MVTKRTSARVARIAAKNMKAPSISPKSKSASASALAQKGSNKVTGRVVAAKASQVMRDGRTSNFSKSGAASALTQVQKGIAPKLPRARKSK